MTGDKNRRRALLDAASQAFGSKGFAGSRVDAIARAAGVNKQLIFYYFGSKRGLYQATLREEAGGDAARLACTAPATDQLRVTLRGILDWFDTNPQARVALFDPTSDTATVARILGALVRPLTDAISTGQGLGYFRDGAEPDLVARQAVVLCAGWHAMQDAAGPRDAWLDGVLDTLRRSLAW